MRQAANIRIGVVCPRAQVESVPIHGRYYAGYAMAPFIVPMLWAGILAFASWPLYVRLLDGLRGRDCATPAPIMRHLEKHPECPVYWLPGNFRLE